ncbi:hypothetical protein [Kitasatospora sp. NPDC050543]|uniref:hypothetical protein n=1 Tax=Kitasatospora sp. NPDC050543 TaxID=3364054 RepID=UPI0037AF0078
MAIFMHAELPGVSSAQYNALNAALQQLPGNPFEGCLSHVAIANGGGMSIYDLWESRQAMDAFVERMMPVAQGQGLPQPPSQPTVSEVHNYWMPNS